MDSTAVGGSGVQIAKQQSSRASSSSACKRGFSVAKAGQKAVKRSEMRASSGALRRGSTSAFQRVRGPIRALRDPAESPSRPRLPGQFGAQLSECYVGGLPTLGPNSRAISMAR